MQKRNDNNCQKKNIARSDPTYTHLTRLDPTFDVQTRPTMVEFVQLLYNAHKQLNGPASAEEAPHHSPSHKLHELQLRQLINSRIHS